jgi:hypothetical protein
MQALTTIGLDIAKSLSEAGALPDWHRGLRCVASPVAPTAGSGAYVTADAAGLCEAVREAPEGRCRRRTLHGG